MTDPIAVDRRTGAAALTAGVLLFVSVATELVWNVQRPDGSVSDLPVFVLFAGGFVLGSVALVMAVHGLGRGRTGAALSRTGRIGRGVSLTGAGLVTAFAVVHLGTGLATGTPLEASFWAFFLGFLLLIAGAVPLALGLRRSSAVGGWWGAVLVAGIAAAVAMFAQAPLHELGLFTFDAAWAALGLRLLSGRDATVSEDTRVRG
ncbi:hypothetical protein [Blastococcus saxobsidens]|uniref:DUF998 domain-containing protein n=1 Tax=Blastococcus saxobsidens (strain DD2) TaxID=1146883 RepID=H6RVC8_BLASD|nr:hypothetical protein [Blastococcus saxobsidens]CCG02005.1 membrane protein of unknown function [Blastococcus saxobsidens DD2]